MKRVIIFVLVAIILGAWFINQPNSEAATGLVSTNGAGGQGSNGWTNPANAQGIADNNTYATAAPGNNSRISGVWNTYNFDSSLPLHAVITKVEILVQYNVSTTLSVANLEMQSVVGGVNCPASPIIDSSEPTSDTDIIADITSCRSWQRSDLLNANFGTLITAHRGSSFIFGVTFSLDYVQVRVTYNTPDYNQSAYRWYDNTDSTSVGVPLAAQDSVPTLYAPHDRIRLRVLLHVTTTTLLISSEQFKLQFAQKSGGTCVGLSYADVTGSSIIAYYNNPAPADGAGLTADAQDPMHSGHTTISQTYEENNPFSTSSNVAVGQDGMWDIVLVGNGAVVNTTYCFRLVVNNGSLLTTYSVYPELTTSPPASLTADIVDASGNSVSSPSYNFSGILTPFLCESTTATLGTSSQRIRLKNTTTTPGWTLSIAATDGSSALWSAGSPKYDFNDNSGSPPGCAAGLDSDIYAGQMTINASTGTVTPRAVSACTIAGITKGSSAAFVEGSLNAITLLSASASASTGCYWELVDVSASQQIPGGQSNGSYSISLTITVAAS